MAYQEVGSEFLVNRPVYGSREGTSLSIGLAGGGYVVIWEAHDGDLQQDVRARVFDAAGNAVGAPVTLFQDYLAEHFQRQISAVALPNGNFAVAVGRTLSTNQFGQAQTQETSLSIFGPGGAAIGPPISVSTVGGDGIGGYRTEPDLSIAGDRIVVTWLEVGSAKNIQVRTFGFDGGSPSSIISFGETPSLTSGGQTTYYTIGEPDVAGFANGGFVVVWKSKRTDGNVAVEAIKAQIFDRNGVAVAPEFFVSNNSKQVTPQVVALENGTFVVGWADFSGPTMVLKGQQFSTTGVKIGSEFLIADTRAPSSDSADSFSITALLDGGFAFAWQNYQNKQIYLRHFDQDATAMGVGAIVSNGMGGLQSIASLADGGLVVNWGWANTIYAQRFEAVAGPGNDTLYARAGNDVLDGGGGVDTLIYSDLFRSYEVQRNGASATVVGGKEGGTDTLTSIEILQFKDGKFVFDADGVAAQVTRLYDTVLQRAPDQAGLDLWVDRLEDQGGTLKDVAKGFLGSPEFQAKTGSLSNADYVEFLYQNALGRASDPGGKAAWINQLDSGASDRADLLIGFSESPEHRGLTADLIAKGFFNTDDAYQAVALLYDSFAGRLPDSGGLIGWAEAIKSGAMTISQVAAGFANSAEFQNLTAGMSHAQLVEFMYQNTLNRGSDPGGKQAWVNALDAGLSDGNLLMGFSQSQEHFYLLGDHITNGIDYF